MRRAAGALDVAAVVVFVLIGRSSHHHGLTVGGFVDTAWPFALGLAVGWVVAAKRAPASLLGGAVICALTVVVGMTMRVVAGQGTAVAFVAVALGFLGAVMLPGRLLLASDLKTVHERPPRTPS